MSPVSRCLPTASGQRGAVPVTSSWFAILARACDGGHGPGTALAVPPGDAIAPTTALPSCPTEKLVNYVHNCVIGEGATLPGPFGERRLTYLGAFAPPGFQSG